MLTRLQQFFQQHLAGDGDNRETLTQRLQLAAATLMVEIMHADERITADENERLHELLAKRFRLNTSEIEVLIELAQEKKQQATDYYSFTSLLNSHYTQQEKVRLVEDLWQLAYADNELDKFEEHLIRRLADLLHVPHRDFMRTKHRAMPPDGHKK